MAKTKKGKSKNVTTKKGATRVSASKRTPARTTQKSRKGTRTKLNESNSKRRTKRATSKARKTNRKAQKYSAQEKQLQTELWNEFQEIIVQDELEEQEVKEMMSDFLIADNKIITSKKRIYSQVLEKDYSIRNFKINFEKSDILNFQNLKAVDSQELYEHIEPYFTKIFSRIRKHPLFFFMKFNTVSEKIDLKNGKLKDIEFDAVSTPKQDAEIIPDEFYAVLRQLCDNFINWVSQYEKRGIETTLIGAEFQVYDKEHKPRKLKK